MGETLQGIGVGIVTAVLVETFSPGFFANIGNAVNVGVFRGKLRGVQNQIINERVEEMIVDETPSENNEMSPSGGL